MNRTDIEFIQKNVSSGKTEDGIPWIAIPDRPGRDSFTLDEILEALRLKHKAHETGPEKDAESRKE